MKNGKNKKISVFQTKLAINSLFKVSGEKELIGSAIAFSLMTVCVKQLNGRLPLAELVFVRAIISLIITRLMIRNVQVNPWGKNKRLLLLRGFLGTIALFCIFKAIESLPLASATIIQYTYPTFTAIITHFCIKEKVTKYLGLAAVIGWAGVSLIANKSVVSIDFINMSKHGLLIGLCGAFLTALAYLCVKELSKKEDQLVIIFYFPLVSAPLTLPFFLKEGIWPTWNEWALLLAIGLLAQIGQILITEGIKIIPAIQASTINYSQIIFSIIWGILLFKEGINFSIVAGAILIFIAGTISIRSN